MSPAVSAPRARSARRMAIVPADGRAGSSLVALVAALAYLAALAAGTAALVAARSAEWSREVAAAATIQVRPLAGRDVEADLARAAAIARASPGVRGARVLGRPEAERLVEPWLGRGLDLSDLPVPRLVALDLDPSATPDLTGLAARLSAEVAGASLDDHSAWLGGLVRAARTAIGLALAAVVLVLGASAGAIAFATHGAVAASRDVIDVLHYVGAEDGYIARRFAWRFVRLALIGGLAGAAAASLTLALAVPLAALGNGLVAGAGPWPPLACLAVALADGAAAALVTSRTVRRTLRAAFRG